MLGSNHSIVNSVVFDFDSLVDYKIGIVRTLQKNMKEANGVNHWYLTHSTIDDLKIDRINSIEDIVYKSLDGSRKEQYIEFTEYMLSSEYEADCYMNGVPTKLFTLLHTYMKTSAIMVDVLCRNELQKHFIETMLKHKSPNIMISSRADMNMDKYGVIYLGYFKHILELPEFGLKHFVVPAYRENFEDENSQLMKYVLPYTDINKFGFVEPYNRVTKPIG